MTEPYAPPAEEPIGGAFRAGGDPHGSPGQPVMTELLPPGPPPGRRSALRSWLHLAIAMVLVGCYLSWWLTYSRLHLAPNEYEQLPAGQAATKLGAEFTLISLEQTTQLLDQFDKLNPADANAVWVLAKLEVTPRTIEENFNCLVPLVAANGRVWDPVSLGPSREQETCTPDDAQIGRTYPIEILYQVPDADVGQIAGIELSQFKAGRDPVLTPRA